MIHEITIDKDEFYDIFMGKKTFKVLYESVQTGDIIILKEWDAFSKEYTDNMLARNVTFVENINNLQIASIN